MNSDLDITAACLGEGRPDRTSENGRQERMKLEQQMQEFQQQIDDHRNMHFAEFLSIAV